MGSFHGLTVVDAAAVTIWAHPFAVAFLYSLGQYPVVPLLDHRAFLFPASKGVIDRTRLLYDGSCGVIDHT